MEELNLRPALSTARELGIAVQGRIRRRIALPLSSARRLRNFNPERLRNKPADAYPPNNSPRGYSDVSSVHWHARRFRRGLPVNPIVITQTGRSLTLLDGAHRIVAAYIAGLDSLPAVILE